GHNLVLRPPLIIAEFQFNYQSIGVIIEILRTSLLEIHKDHFFWCREEVPGDEKIEKQLVGVGDEEGLKKMMDSDEETDSDEEDLTKKLLNNDGERKKEHLDIEERDSSGSDTDDPDKEKIDSVVFMPKKEVPNGGEPSTSGAGKKRPAESDPSGPENSNDAKRPKS
ncbi:hypothetical protein ANCCAN_28933, partial [Ancylostoma caninum]